MSLWNDLKQLFFGKPLSVQFEQILLEEEARKQNEARTTPTEEPLLSQQRIQSQLLNQLQVRKRNNNHSLNIFVMVVT
jgi:hypothetical protein